MYRRTVAALKMTAACALMLALMGAMSTSTAAQTLCTNNSALAAVDTNGDGIATAGEISSLAPDNAELQAAVGQLQGQGYSGIQYTGCTPGDGGTGTGGGTGDGGAETGGGTGDGGAETGGGTGDGGTGTGGGTGDGGAETGGGTGDGGTGTGDGTGDGGTDTGDGTGNSGNASVAGDSGSAEGAATGGGGSNTGAAQVVSGESVVAVLPSAGSGSMVTQGQSVLPISLAALVLVSFTAFVVVQRRHAR